ncbi:LytR/AlgR family response regulator transcription factor [Labilibacter marinus]|uniref:LytR/AlgR family response regulator transcription factor n=1 Tax=Labilibacter marinus TaxID=1477105 RepID=UPI0008378F0A|nr:LytTR family DNA-binding domain-containing protein [Labilibacter marinus]
MDVLIIEDEPLAAEHLTALVKACDSEINIVETLDSVASAENWLKTNVHPSLIFMDVHLGDGICFEIFKRVSISSFIIFTTAYDQYALQAFKVNSVDYLLKPLNQEMLCTALDKYKSFASNETINQVTPDINKLIDAIQNKTTNYKERFVVKVGTHIRPVKVDEIACFYSMEKATYLHTKSGKNYLVDYALDKLIDLLNPENFFRISRKHIVSLNAIEDVISVGPSRIKVKIQTFQEDELVVSRDKIKPFKAWLEG